MKFGPKSNQTVPAPTNRKSNNVIMGASMRHAKVIVLGHAKTEFCHTNKIGTNHYTKGHRKISMDRRNA